MKFVFNASLHIVVATIIPVVVEKNVDCRLEHICPYELFEWLNTCVNHGSPSTLWLRGAWLLVVHQHMRSPLLVLRNNSGFFSVVIKCRCDLLTCIEFCIWGYDFHFWLTSNLEYWIDSPPKVKSKVLMKIIILFSIIMMMIRRINDITFVISLSCNSPSVANMATTIVWTR